MKHFNTQWHKQSVALEWPRGSVVLIRTRDPASQIHGYSYVLSLFFTPEAVTSSPDWEFMLVEERKT